MQVNLRGIAHFWAQLHYPLAIVHLNGFWIISPKGHVFNVLHNEQGMMVVFKTKEEAEAAFEKVKEIRKTVKYLKKIKVEGL